MHGMIMTWIGIIACLYAAAPRARIVADESRLHIDSLLNQGVLPGRIHGLDADGIPLVCGTAGSPSPPPRSALPIAGDGLPPDTRSWECVPGVIRSDGVEAFRLEVAVNGAVTGVSLDNVSGFLVSPEAPPISLRDDGQNEDRVAGDSVFTAGPFRYDTAISMPDFFWNYSSSPAGLHQTDVGTITIEELDGTETTFLISPSFGLLRADIPDVTFDILSPDAIASQHLINIRTSLRETQRFLRFLGADLRNASNLFYEVMPDSIDFFIFFSTNKVERLPRTASPNYVAGAHLQVQTNFIGTGRMVSDGSETFGSHGILLGVNALDAFHRGLWSGNATHELLHQWSAYTDSSLGLSDGTGHYSARSNAASLVGGFQWVDNGDGTYTLNCHEGRNGARSAPAIDKYVMGLIEGASVAPLHVNDGISLPKECGGSVESLLDVTIEQIQAVHGVRDPGPARAQRSFRIAFVAESHHRFLNPTEMTFYSILAEHYTRPIPTGQPSPFVGPNWAGIDRFFGDGSTWHTRVQRFHDADADGDVDIGDFAAFVECLSGPAATLTRGCQVFNQDGDRDVDLADLRSFENAFNEP